MGPAHGSQYLGSGPEGPGPCGRSISQVTRSNLVVNELHYVSDSQAAGGVSEAAAASHIVGLQGRLSKKSKQHLGFGLYPRSPIELKLMSKHTHHQEEVFVCLCVCLCI